MAQFTRTKADAQHMEGNAAAIADQIEVLNTCFTRLEDVMARLDAGWDGEANAQFMANYSTDGEFIRSLLAGHRMLNSTLRAGGKAYGEADSTVNSQIRALPGAR